MRSHLSPTGLFGLLLTVFSSHGTAQTTSAPPPLPIHDAPSAERISTLRKAAARKVEVALAEKEATLQSLRAAAEDAAKALPEGSDVATRLQTAAREAQEAARTDASAAIDDLERSLETLASDLAFEPYLEAPLAKGWPPLAPVSDVVLKQYPVYRMATATMERASEGGAFWKLFQHIQSHDIPMTAPVQMDGSGKDDAPARMAFLYESAKVGELGVDGAVEVVDAEPTLAISVGARGYRNPTRIDALAKQLEAWLAENGKRLGLRSAGAIRIMGYNGPGVSATRRFFEVELPVTALAGPQKEE